MNRSNGETAHDLEELVARALFQDLHKFRSWERSKGYLQSNAKKRAKEAMKRAGIMNIGIETEIANYPKEGDR